MTLPVGLPGGIGPFAPPPLTREVLGRPVTEGRVPRPWAAAIVDEPVLWADHDRLLFDAEDAAVYVDAEAVVIEARAPGARAECDWLLYATAARAVLTFAHRFNLHGTLVTSPSGAAVAILGGSMAGKSTTTIELLRRGWTFACDDIVEVALSPEGPVAHPVERPIHLSDPAATMAGADLGVGRPLAGREKRAYVLEGDLAPRPLAALVLLGPRPEVGAVEVSLLEPLAALALVAASADRYGILHLPEHRADLLAWSAELARQVPLWEVRRPLERDTVAAVADAVAALVSD